MEKGPLLGVGRTAEIFAWSDTEILKLYRSTFPADAINYEIQINEALRDLDFSLAKIRGVVEVEGRRGVIYDRVDGPSMLQLLLAKPWKVNQMARLLAKLHAEMHHCTAPALPSGLEVLTNRVQRVQQLPVETKNRILKIVDTLPDGDTLCHGDFHLDNVLMAPAGPVIIDWMTATRGNFLGDVARSSLILRYGASPHTGLAQVLITFFKTQFHNQYLQEYCRLTGITPADLEVWLLPLAAARLLESCPPTEERIILRLIEELLTRH